MLSSGRTVLKFHEAGRCWGGKCPVHNPSEHEYRDYPLDFINGYMVRLGTEFEHGFTIDPDDYYNLDGQALVRNSIICLNCQEQIESRFRHDHVTCSCGQCSVDGGRDYQRFGGTNWRDTSIIFKK